MGALLFLLMRARAGAFASGSGRGASSMAFEAAAATSLECRALEALASSIAGFWGRALLLLLGGGGLPVSTSPCRLRSSKPSPGVDERLRLVLGAGEVARGVTAGLTVELLLLRGCFASFSESASSELCRVGLGLLCCCDLASDFLTPACPALGPSLLGFRASLSESASDSCFLVAPCPAPAATLLGFRGATSLSESASLSLLWRLTGCAASTCICCMI